MNWETFRLEEVCTKVTDGTHDTPATVPDGYPLIKGKDISSGYVDFENCSHVSEAEHLAIIKRSKPEKGDILFANIGNSIGDCAYIKTERPFSIKNVALFKPNPEMIQSRFLFYIVSGEKFIGEILAAKSGSAQPFVSLAALRRHEIKIPPLPIQQKIAGILSAYDDLIENNLKRIKLLEELAQITYEEWFVRLRFPGHESTSINPETNLPEGWKKRPFKEIGAVITGKTPSTENKAFYGNDVAFVKTPDMSGNTFVISSEQMLSFDGADSQKKKLLPKKSLMVSCIGTAGVVALTAIPTQTNQQINSIVFNDDRYTYLTYLFAKGLKPLLEALGSNGATMTNVNTTKFEGIEMIVPSDDILSIFHDKVSCNFEVILHLLNQNQRLREARDILLPRLMTGMIDVEQYDPTQLMQEAA